MESLVTKRPYNRRTEEEQLRDLQEKVAELKAQAEAKARLDQPVVREWPKAQRALRTFMQVAMDNRREDLAISVQAFLAGIERTLNPEREKRGGREDRD